MYSNSKKMQLIEEVLRENNSHVLKEIESVLKKSKKPKSSKRHSIKDVVGLWSKNDAELIEKAIEAGCEQINPDDWK